MNLRAKPNRDSISICQIAIIQGFINGVFCDAVIWFILWANLISDSLSTDWSFYSLWVILGAMLIGNTTITVFKLKNTNYMLKVAYILIGLLSFLITFVIACLLSPYIIPLDLPPEDLSGGMLIIFTAYVYGITYLASFVFGIVTAIILKKQKPA